MSNHVQSIIEKLRLAGHRLTLVRQAVLEFLDMRQTPCTVAEIQQGLVTKLGRSIHKTTVYRELEFLIEQRVIQPLEFHEDLQRYELVSEHHHHMVCSSCKRIEEIEVGRLEKTLRTLERQLGRDTRFSDIYHRLDFFGRCAKCR